MKRVLLLPLLLFLFFLLAFPKLSLISAKAGLMLWFYTLLPTMLPFMILSNIFIRTRLLNRLFCAPQNFWRHVFCLSPNGSYALVMGVFCGYPMGAKITADLYREGRISRQEACYLLTFSNHPGPSFLSGYLCIGLFHRTDLIPVTYSILYLSSFLSSLFFRFRYFPGAKLPKTAYCDTKKEISSSHSFGEILDISIMDGFEAITRLGGYILLFSIVQGILKQLLHNLPHICCILLGIVEVTTGISAISQNSWQFHITYPLILTFTAFGGLCVAAQTKSMLTDTDLPFAPYLKGKIFCALCTLLISKFLVEIIKVVV